MGYLRKRCDCRPMARTGVCGTPNKGSIPFSHPILKYTRLDNWSVGGAPTSCSVGSIPTARAIWEISQVD